MWRGRVEHLDAGSERRDHPGHHGHDPGGDRDDPATTASTPTATAKPAETVTRPSTTTAPRGSGGGTASFRAPSGDNSIPDYGSEAPPSERERAATALAAFLRARANGEWSTACTYLAATTRTQFERILGRAKAKAGGCARVLAELSKGSAAAHAETLTSLPASPPCGSRARAPSSSSTGPRAAST